MFLNVLMATLTISVPSQITQQIDSEVKRGRFATRSEFFRNLLRKYFSGQLKLESFDARPLGEIKLELAKTGKYSEKFIDSVVRGLGKSSVYAN